MDLAAHVTFRALLSTNTGKHKKIITDTFNKKPGVSTGNFLHATNPGILLTKGINEI